MYAIPFADMMHEKEHQLVFPRLSVFAGNGKQGPTLILLKVSSLSRSGLHWQRLFLIHHNKTRRETQCQKKLPVFLPLDGA